MDLLGPNLVYSSFLTGCKTRNDVWTYTLPFCRKSLQK
jgi:hypothetical protein